MAKSRKKNKRVKKAHEIGRNWTAVSAILASGAGIHQDRRTRRKRTRASQKRAALSEY